MFIVNINNFRKKYKVQNVFNVLNTYLEFFFWYNCYKLKVQTHLKHFNYSKNWKNVVKNLFLNEAQDEKQHIV